MEESYAVHRRRKVAGKKREKTPEPFSRNMQKESSEDEEDEARRARMEQMAEDAETEGRSKQDDVESDKRFLLSPADANLDRPERSRSKVSPISFDGSRSEGKKSPMRTFDVSPENMSEIRRLSLIGNEEVKKSERKLSLRTSDELAKSDRESPFKTSEELSKYDRRSSLMASDDLGKFDRKSPLRSSGELGKSERKSSLGREEPRNYERKTSLRTNEEDSRTIREDDKSRACETDMNESLRRISPEPADTDAKRRRSEELRERPKTLEIRPVGTDNLPKTATKPERKKKKSRERAVEKHARSTDSSDVDENFDRGPRRTRSPEKAKLRTKRSTKSRPLTSGMENVSSFIEFERSASEVRSSSRPRRGEEGVESEKRSSSRPRRIETTSERLESEIRSSIASRRNDIGAESETRPGRTRRSSQPNDTDEDQSLMMKKKPETYSGEPLQVRQASIGRTGSEIRKQIIPIRKDSFADDLVRAQQAYLRGRNILEPNSSEYFYDNNEDMELRRRKTKIPYREQRGKDEAEETNEDKAEKRSWFSWFPFFRSKKVKNEDQEDEKITMKEERKPEPEVPKIEQECQVVRKRVTLMELFRVTKDIFGEFRAFKDQNPQELMRIRSLRNRCMAELLLAIIYCGLGAFVFRFTEGAFETFYKCGVKRVKRDFLDSLWNYSHNMREDDWKSMARRKLMEFEEQLHTAHEAGVHTYSGQKSWTFLNAVVYCLTVITTIGYGHIYPSTNTGRAITIVYAIFGIPMFLIVLADFGKLFTRGIKFLWAFVRRVYYTGSCRKVRRTVPVQEMMKGVQLVYDLATFRRPSQMNPEEIEEMQKHAQNQTQTVLNLDGNMPETPGTPAMSTYAIDDEFNLPISVAIVILLCYIFIGATLYYMWEQWGFFESFYFVFISMSTIGFGDYVPQHPMYMMCSIVYLVFGLALTSMCINVVQVMLSDSFRQASHKIGATIGFQVSEDDGSIKPAAPPAVEVAEVHSPVKDQENKEKLAPTVKQEDVDL